MKGLFGFGSPKKQRYSMQFGYDVRSSFWQELKANSHLVIAAVGTLALLGIAGTALWFAVPGDRPAFAESKPQTEDAAKPATVSEAEAVAPVVSSEVAPKADPVTKPAAAEADNAALPRSDPRWTAAGKPAPIDAAAVAVDNPEPEGQARTAFAEEDTRAEDAGKLAEAPPASDETDSHAEPDPKAATAAIPAARPEPPAEEAGAAADGRILRAVTMRSGPRKGAAAIGTIPAKGAVEVISCKSWCEVVYKGKRGFIYKSFLQRGG